MVGPPQSIANKISSNSRGEKRSSLDNSLEQHAPTVRISPASPASNSATLTASIPVSPPRSPSSFPLTERAETSKKNLLKLVACTIVGCFLVAYLAGSKLDLPSGNVINRLTHDISGSDQTTATELLPGGNSFMETFNHTIQYYDGERDPAGKLVLREKFIPLILHNGTLLCRRDHQNALIKTVRTRTIIEMINTGLTLYQQENVVHKVRRDLPILLHLGDQNGCNNQEQQDIFDFPRLTWSYPSPKYGTNNWCHAIPVPSYSSWDSFHKKHKSQPSWKSTFASNSKQYSWSSKINKAVWRGASTYNIRFTGMEIDEIPRGQLVKKSMEYPDLIDASFVKFTQQYASRDNELLNKTVLTERMPFDDQMKYKAILDVDGNNWSSRFPKLLCTNSVVIKIDPDFIEHFYHELMPMVHYVPASLENVTDVLSYVLDEENEEEMRKIIHSANMWCKRKMTEDQMAKDMMIQLEEYQVAIDDLGISNSVQNDFMSSILLNDGVKDLDLIACS